MEFKQQLKQPTSTPLSTPISQPHPQYFFTQLSLISYLLSTKLKQSLTHQKFHIHPYKINQQGDISVFTQYYQSQSNNNKFIQDHINQNISLNFKQINHQDILQKIYYQYSIHITIIQIQTIIKFHIIYKQLQVKINKIKYQDHHSLQQQHKNYMINQNNNQNPKNPYKDRKQHQYIDQFWIKYTNYLPPKLYQSYLFSDFNNINTKQKTAKLIHIFQHRIIQPIIQKIQQLQAILHHTLQLTQPRTHVDHNSTSPPAPHTKMTNKQLLITVISSNFTKIYKYLTPSQYKNLQISSRQLYKILHTHKNYKILFQLKWGKTGFDLEQKNWIKMYQNKIIDTYSKKKHQYSTGIIYV